MWNSWNDWGYGKCPCHRCEDRKLNCHSGCKQYKEWTNQVKRANNRRKRAERKERNGRNFK